MSQGRIGRSTRRYPAARRRATLFAQSRYGRRARGLPPHLIPGVRNQKKPETVFSRRNFIVGACLTLVFAFFTFVSITVASAISGAVATVRAYRKVNSELPDAASIAVNTFQTTRIFDRKGKLLQEIDHPDYGWRTFVRMDQMTDDFINATVSSEDSTFWTNHGVEPFAILRGGFIIFSGAGSSGGSTITQQLVRAVFPEQISANDISITRKMREALAAYALAEEYSKEDIFTMYVNQIYYGSRSYGVEAAANTYFNKHASELTLAESALLAGLPQAPSYYDPSTDEGFPRAKERQRYVLEQMAKYRYISRADADAAFKESIQIVKEPRTNAIKAAPHFTLYIQNHLMEEYGDEAVHAGLSVYTSIDLDLQAEAETIVNQQVAAMQQYKRNNAACVVMVPWSGEILAMVGSADYNNASIEGQVNYADSPIQPGSSMKPIAYAAAFKEGWHPAQVVMDVPTSWDVGNGKKYEPKNYSQLFYGAVTVRKALSNSFNIDAVKAAEFASVQGVMDMARKMGMKKSLSEDASFYGLALALGSGEVRLVEHVNCYATLANNGRHVPINPIQKITDGMGNEVFKVDNAEVAKTDTRAMDPGIAYALTSILTDNKSRSFIFGEDNRFGNTQSSLGRPTAAKSGTTEDWRDLWTMGYTTDVAVGAWCGRSGDAGEGALSEIDGIDAAGPIWQDLMLLIHGNEKYQELLLGPDGEPLAEDFPVPDSAHKMKLCSVTGHVPVGNDNTIEDWVVKGIEPTMKCNEVDTWERKQLDNALQQVRKGANWAGGAESSVNAYAREVGNETVPDSGNDDNNNDGNDNESPPIEPID